MFVYIRSRSEQLYVVGFYAPDGKWVPESDWDTAIEAAKQVHWLNGGADVELTGLRARIEALEEAEQERVASEQLKLSVDLYKIN